MRVLMLAVDVFFRISVTSVN